MSDNIVVALRVRPLIVREITDAHKLYWKVENNCIIQRDPDSKKNIISCEFDKVFDSDITNNGIYEEIAFPIVQSVLAGINGTIFAYGQTSSGKTFTMTGNKGSPGIIPLAINDIFQSIENTPDREFLLRASYMEIYQENISDLITGQKISTLREDSSGSVYVPGLKETCVTNENMLLNIMAEGDKNRKVAETNMNERSSRSHSIFRLIVESRNVNDKECDGIVTVSHLNLVDLAGSENATQTGATGERLKEGSSINKSLFMLGRVISQLSDGESYVNYRDSKLTRILQTSIGGNAKTAMICTITPANKEQSLSSVRFASRAKSIKNKPIVNEVMSEAAMLKRYVMEINKLKSALENERNTDKAQEVEQVKEKLDEQERQNLELQEKLKALKEILVVSSLKKDQPSFKEKKTRRETWAAPAIKRFRRSEFDPTTSEFLKPFVWSSSSLKFSPVSEEESADLISPEPNLSHPDKNNSCISIASFYSPSESVLYKGEISKLEGMDSSFLSPELLPKRNRLRKCVNFSSSVNVWPSFKDVECQTDNSLLPKPLYVEQLTPGSNKSRELITTPPGVTPRAILRSRNKELHESLDKNEDWLENWNCEIRELSEFQKNEIHLLSESFCKKEDDGTTDVKVKSLSEEVKSLRRSLQDSEQLYLDVNKINSEQAQEIKYLNEQLDLLRLQRDKYIKSHEESIMFSELNVKLKKSLEEKDRNLASLQHDKQDFDIMMELALQKQKQVENDLRLCLEESWADIAKLERTSKVDVQKRLQENHDIKSENSSLKVELNECKNKGDLLLDKIKDLESQVKKFENDFSVKSAQNEAYHSEIQNLRDRFINGEGKRLKSEDSEDLYSPLWTTAREKSELEVSRMSTSYAVNPAEMSQKLSETISSLEEFGLSSIVRQLNYLPFDPFDTTAIDIFKEMLLKLHDYYSSLEQQFQPPHIMFPDEEKIDKDSAILLNSYFNHEIIRDYELTLTTWNLLNSICYDYYKHYLEKFEKDSVEVKSDCVIEKAFKLGLTKLQESFNQSKEFMKHIDFESFIDEESSFTDDHLLASNDGEPVLSFSDELKMLNDSNSEGDMSSFPEADNTIIEISKSALLIEISQLQKNEEKYKSELLSIGEKVKLLESDLLLLQTSNDKLSQLSHKSLCDLEVVAEYSTVGLAKEVCNSEVEKLREKCKTLEERLFSLELVKSADSSNSDAINLDDLKVDCKFEDEILELKNAIASSQADLSKLLPFKNKFNEQVVINDRLKRELELAKCICTKEVSRINLNYSLSDIRDASDHALADYDKIALQCVEDDIELKDLKVNDKWEEEIFEHNHYLTANLADVSKNAVVLSKNKELELNLKEKEAELDAIKQQLDVYVNYDLKVIELEKAISKKDIEIELMTVSLQSYSNYKEGNVDELDLKQPSAAKNKRDGIADCRNSPSYLFDESEHILLKENFDKQKKTIVKLRKELEEYKDKEDELESMITDFTIKEAQLEEKEASLKELENKLQEMKEDDKISSLKLTAEIADKEKYIEELKEIVLACQHNSDSNDSFKDALKPDVKNVRNCHCIYVNKGVQTITCEFQELVESPEIQGNKFSNDFEQLVQFLIDCNVISANDIEECNIFNNDVIFKASDRKHQKVIIKLQEYINHCQTELMETSKVETLISEHNSRIFDLENSVKELESCLRSKEKYIESLASSVIEKDTHLQKLKESIMTVIANDCDDGELVQNICNWKSQMESKFLLYELSKSEGDDRERQLEDDVKRKSLEIESLKELIEKEASMTQSHGNELIIKNNLIGTLKMKINDLECSVNELELQLTSIYELQQDMELKNKEIMRLQENCCNLEAALCLKKQEIIQLKESYDDQIQNLLTSLKTEEIEVLDLSECLNKQEEKLKQTDNPNEGTLGVTKTLENNIDELENTLQERCYTIDRLLVEKAEQGCTVDNLKADLLTLKTNYNEIISEKQNLARELSIRQEKVEELSHICNVLKTDKELTDSKTANIVESLDSTQVELQNQMNLLSIKEDKIKELQNNLNILDEEHLKCGLEIENLVNLVENYKLDGAKKDLELEKLITEKKIMASELKINTEEIQKLSLEIGQKLDNLASFEAREILYKKEIDVLNISEENCKGQLSELRMKSEEILCQNAELLEEIRILQETNKDISLAQRSLKEELQKETENNLDTVNILSEYETMKLTQKSTEAEMEVLHEENEKNVLVIKNLELVIGKLTLIEQELTDQVKDGKNKANEYNNENKYLLENIQLLSQKNAELSKLNDSIKVEIYNLRHKNADSNELFTENEKLKSDIENIESKYQEIYIQNKKFEEEILSLIKKNKELCKLNDSVKTELRKVNEQNLYCEQLMSENEKLKLVIENIELESEALTSENKRNVQTIKNLEIEVAKLQLSKNEFLNRIKNVENSSDEFSKHNKILQENIQTLQRDNNEFCKLNSSLKVELQIANQQNVDTVKLISENNKLKLLVENAELETIHLENKKNLQIIKDYKFENGKLNLMEQELKVQLKEAENKINKLISQNKKLLDEVHSLQKGNKTHCISCDLSNSALLDGSGKTLYYDTFKLENEKLKLIVENIQYESQKQCMENNINIESIKNLKTELQAVKASVDELSNQNKQLLEEVQSTHLENNRLCKQFEETKIELQDKIEECKALDKELDETISEYKNSHSHVQGKCSELRNQVQKLVKEKSQLNESLSSLATNASVLYQKRDCSATEIFSNTDIICEDLKNQVSELENENLSEKRKLSEICLPSSGLKSDAINYAEMKLQFDTLSQKNKELIQLLETTRKELMLKTEECNSLDKELDDTISEYKKQQSYVSEINSGLKKQVQELEKDKSRLSETLAWQSNHTLLDYSSQSKVKNEAPVAPHHDLLVLEKQHLEKEFSCLKKENKNLIIEINTLRNSNAANTKEISELHSNISQLESEIKKLHEGVNKVDFVEIQKEYVSLLEKYAIFDGMEDCQLQDMHRHYVNVSTNSNSKDVKHDELIKELKERYFEIERENNVLKMNLDALNAPALKEAKKLKDCLESETMKNRQLMRELRRLQNMKDTSICESSAPKKVDSKAVARKVFDEDPARLSCGSQIVMDVQVMRLKNENYNLEKEKNSLQQENKLLNEHLEHYKMKGREWKTKCYKASLALKEKQVENSHLTKKLEGLYLQQSKFGSPINSETLKDPNSSVQAANPLKQNLQPPLQQISTNKTSDKVCSSISTEVEKPDRKKVEKENHGRVSVGTRMPNLDNEEECKTQ